MDCTAIFSPDEQLPSLPEYCYWIDIIIGGARPTEAETGLSAMFLA